MPWGGGGRPSLEPQRNQAADASYQKGFRTACKLAGGEKPTGAGECLVRKQDRSDVPLVSSFANTVDLGIEYSEGRGSSQNEPKEGWEMGHSAGRSTRDISSCLQMREVSKPKSEPRQKACCHPARS